MSKKVKFHFYDSKTQLETDISASKIVASDLVVLKDSTEGTLIWSHGNYVSITETEFKRLLDLYSANDIIVGTYDTAESAEDIEETDSISDALGKLEYKVNQKKATVQVINLFDFAEDNTPIDIEGDFSVIYKNPEDSDIYLSSHHRYLQMPGSGSGTMRIDCLFHSVITGEYGKGLLYSFLIKDETGKWSVSAYISIVDEVVFDSSLQEAVYTTEEEAKEAYNNLKEIALVAFGENEVVSGGSDINDSVVSTSSTWSSKKIENTYIPYNSFDESEKLYTIENKGIQVTDSQNSSSHTLINGQTIIASTEDGKKVSVQNNDSIAVALGDGNIVNNEAQNMNILSMVPSMEGDDGFVAKHNIGNTEVQGRLQSTLVEFKSTIDNDGTTREGKIEMGFTGENANVLNNNDLYFKLTHPESGKSSLYALKNAELENSEPKYLATEEYVNERHPDWNIIMFDTEHFNSHSNLEIEAPEGFIFDELSVLIQWYGPAKSVAGQIFGGFYHGTNTTQAQQVLLNNGTNKMGAGYITANIKNLNDMTAIAMGEAYLYNNNGSATSLNNPINSYGIGRFSHVNDFHYFSFHNYPQNLDGAYCCIKYKLKREQ